MPARPSCGQAQLRHRARCPSRLRSPPPPKRGKRGTQEPRTLRPWPLSPFLGQQGFPGPAPRPSVPPGAQPQARAPHPAPRQRPAPTPCLAPGAPHLLAPVEQALALGPHVEQRPHPLAQLLDGGFAGNVLDGARLGAVDGADLDPHRGAGNRGPGPLCLTLRSGRRAPPGPAPAASPGRLRFSARGASANARADEDGRGQPRDRSPGRGGRKRDPPAPRAASASQRETGHISAAPSVYLQSSSSHMEVTAPTRISRDPRGAPPHAQPQGANMERGGALGAVTRVGGGQGEGAGPCSS